MAVRKTNYEYETAVNGLEAVQKYEKSNPPFDLVLTGKLGSFSAGNVASLTSDTQISRCLSWTVCNRHAECVRSSARRHVLALS